VKSGHARPCAGNAASAENAIDADNDRSRALPGNPDSPPLARYRLRSYCPDFHGPILIRAGVLEDVSSSHGDRVNDVGHTSLFH
jgi:hypothetical protein